MIQKIKNQNISHKAFTLIEMVIVLVIIWIMLMATVFLSGEQIQKVKNKTVKESILAEMQSRYSRNLWSSSFAGEMYDSMDVTFSSWSNEIKFMYNTGDNGSWIENIFSDRFEIKYIIKNYNYINVPNNNLTESISLKYLPYKISCTIWEEENTNVVFVARVNDNKDYCFEINQKNCRLIEVSNSKCETLRCLLTSWNGCN